MKTLMPRFIAGMLVLGCVATATQPMPHRQ